MTMTTTGTELKFRVSPAEFLHEIGWRFAVRGKFLSLKSCPFCGGGGNRDVNTFAVHAADGNFFCHRTKCGEKGSFWRLIELQNLNPRDYLDNDEKRTKGAKKKKFIYGR